MPMYFITGVVNLDLLVKAESVRFLEFKLLVFLLQLTNILGRYFETMNMAFLSYVCSLVLASMQDFCQEQLLMWCLSLEIFYFFHACLCSLEFLCKEKLFLFFHLLICIRMS